MVWFLSQIFCIWSAFLRLITSAITMAPPGDLTIIATTATSPIQKSKNNKKRNRKSAAANLLLFDSSGGSTDMRPHHQQQQQQQQQQQKSSDGGGGGGRQNGPKVCLSRKQIGANWQQSGIAVMRPDPRLPTPPKRLPTTRQGIQITKHIAMDCEMVGIGYAGKKHMLARVSIVNQMCEVLMDRYVRPIEAVVDYRTEVSGIRPRDIAHGDDFAQVQSEVRKLLESRILVGHAVYNDLRVLALEHPPKAIRDTSSYRPLINRITGGATPSLKTLARCVLNLEIQEGEHSSVEDARATMRIYNRYQEEWERAIRRRNN